MIFADAAFLAAATFTLIHLMSVALAAPKCRRRDAPARTPSPAPFVSVVQPLCGVENFSRETIGAAFALDYPAFELLFCVARGDDPVAALVRDAIAARPDVTARLLVGDERPSANPKLNNVVKGWHAAKGDFVAMIDSNLSMPRDLVQRLLEAFEPGVGVVSTAPIGERPGSIGAELECAFLNTHQARWQFAGDATGMGFAQGKALFCRKDFLDSNGGILALGAEAAEDAASTKVVRGAGLRVALVDGPFAQPLGLRPVRAVIDRQRRWSRLRRATFPTTYAPEVLCGIAPPLAACIAGAVLSGRETGFSIAVLFVVWYGAEAALALASGWFLNWRSPFLWFARDLLLPLIWLDGWIGREFVWQGHSMKADDRKRIALGRA